MFIIMGVFLTMFMKSAFGWRITADSAHLDKTYASAAQSLQALPGHTVGLVQ